MEKLKSHCNKCLHTTNHFIVAERKKSGSDIVNPNLNESYEIYWSETFTMLECCGCESVSLKKEYYFSEWGDTNVEYYPPQVSRQLPRWTQGLPKEIEQLLLEVYKALHADSKMLALMGARALVDLYLNEQLGDIGGFAKKLKKLETDGLISKPNSEFLSAALEAGHAAAHRGYKASEIEVSQVIDIVENLLQIYTLKEAAENLKARTPARDQN
jgi:hypothetical protein